MQRSLIKERLSALWWVMHHSDDPKRRTLAISCYLDDSGSHENSHRAIIGGPVFLRKTFFPFSFEWDRCLSLHKIQPPIHMKEFSPDGRFSYLKHVERRSLFSDLVKIINDHEFYSIVVSVNNLEFQEFFPTSKFRGLFGPIPLAFFWCALLNHCVIKNLPRLDRMAYLIGKSQFDSQILESHTWFQSFEKEIHEIYTGSITFDTPLELNALQAADMIAWSNQRKQAGNLGKGFEPLELLTRNVDLENRTVPHFNFPVQRKSTEELAKIIAEGIPIPKKIGRLELSKLFLPGLRKEKE